MKMQIVKTHIENDLVNNEPKLVFTDENNDEWVLSHQSMSYDGAGTTVLKKKSDCWYFDAKNKK